jgi:nicotinate dehydrogenase subunit A
VALRTVHLQVNGFDHAVPGDDATPLLYVLRHSLNLPGTRFGCGSGQCGSCHVLVQGVSVASCDTPLWSAEGKVVTTVEGLYGGGVPGGALHPLQQAFVDEQAAQCGYCLSGILISAAALLQRNANPAETEVRAALDQHLCRCGSHNRIVKAVLHAAKVMNDAAMGAA